ncbi:MAG: hypothetical protein RMJ87_09910 [Cytophagales bacterium]|nr:hypothetical protein [Bernardetiaceae bacterium]MDW8205332.1 hypothetical protein [Cytophagales bacterium]
MPRKQKPKPMAAITGQETQSASQTLTLSIQPVNSKKLNATQRKFNQLVQAIEQLKCEKERIQASVQYVREKIGAELSPLLAELKEKQIQWLQHLDYLHDTMALTKVEKKILRAFILHQADQWAEILDDAFVDSLLEKYETKEDIALRQRQEQLANQFFETFFGFHPEDENAQEQLHNFFEHIHEHMSTNSTRQNNAHFQNAKRSKAEAQQEAKDVRSLYTSLAKALHPDLEPDPMLREQKTELMKKLTQAYERNDLYELMRMQLEYNATGTTKMEEVVDEQLKSYCRVLHKQLSQMQIELWRYIQCSEDAPIIKHFLSYKYDFSPTKFRYRKKNLMSSIQQVQEQISSLQTKQDLVYFLKVIKRSI